MKNPFFSTKTNIKYQRQHETTIDNYVLVFWQTCQNVFLLQFSRFAKLNLSELLYVVKVVFFYQSPLLSVSIREIRGLYFMLSLVVVYFTKTENNPFLYVSGYSPIRGMA